MAKAMSILRALMDAKVVKIEKIEKFLKVLDVINKELD
jgi:hypothetical protein